MEAKKIKNIISIQVSLNGYYFRTTAVNEDGSIIDSYASEWLAPSKIFSTPQFQQRWDEVQISLFSPKATLVPNMFFNPNDYKAALEAVADIDEDDIVEYVEVEEYASKLVFSNSISESLSSIIRHSVLHIDGSKSRILPELYYILRDLNKCQSYNKILLSYKDEYLHLAIAQGRTLILANTYHAVDFTTAQYFLFLAMKNLNLNPEFSVVCLRSPVGEEEELSLYRYFQAVERI